MLKRSWFLLGVLVIQSLACTNNTKNTRGVPGAPGLNGKDGVGGSSGRSCKAQEANEGIQIICDGQEPFFLPHGKSGKDGSSGNDGVSCQIKSTTTQSVILSCPDALSLNGIKEVEVKNGKDGNDGTSCQATPSSFGGVTIKCGSTEFKLEDGNNGRNGLDGRDGRDGKDGQDNFSTELSESEIIGDVTMGSDVVECSVKIRSNDQNLVLRPFLGYLLSDGQILSKDRIFPQDRTQEFDRIKFKLNLYRDFMKPLLPLQCRSAIFADREAPNNTPIALTSYSVSNAKIVQDSPRVLQSANDFDKTVIPSVEGNDILKLALRNTNSPSPSSRCNAKLNFDADVYDRSTEKTIARLNIERELEHTPIDNENILAFDLNDFSSPKNSNVRNVRLFITCNGDKEYKSHMDSKDRHKRNFEIQGTFLPKP